MDLSFLPTLNAVSNSVATFFLVFGWIAIRNGRVRLHRTCMLAAFAASILFLTSYLIYHAQVGSVPFRGGGWVRPVYFAILITHVILAVFVPPLALVALWRAFRGRFADHRRIARWTLPVWLYVSVTGVVVYWMVHRIYGPGG